ncbi:MAG TPA: hypothetical protein VGV38_17810 [Pyrinomonadaceae bacterium]|nr:hypothetical protein [Pyrinomonadaceae bacterium]
MTDYRPALLSCLLALAGGFQTGTAPSRCRARPCVEPSKRRV